MQAAIYLKEHPNFDTRISGQKILPSEVLGKGLFSPDALHSMTWHNQQILQSSDANPVPEGGTSDELEKLLPIALAEEMQEQVWTGYFAVKFYILALYSSILFHKVVA